MDPPPDPQSCGHRCYSFRKLLTPRIVALQNLLQLKKQSNAIPSAGSTEPSESVEQAYGLNESITEKGKSLTNGFPNDGTSENPSSAKTGKKRKIPSREEISKAR